ncbi:DUF11 domain-containing protein [Absiella sp. AM29-15]|uniref:DUF11 domain-containing protein n=1 Tax=Absiella sp. AM29-15 TaxID=2292278 RepID=UPI000E3FDCCD|nr:DUF11 domain-containing protein [Absiella sp. AM29-15]RGC49151.1 DUF11 domain-containing protein [Absiella sp. AM29-15]
MAIINKIDNSASITYGGNSINSNTVSTLLLLAPTITKAVDKPTANIGDTLTYTITITNLSLSALPTLPFTDTIAQGMTFNTGSFTVNGNTATPTITGTTLAYTIPAIPSLGTATIQFKTTVVGGSSTS